MKKRPITIGLIRTARRTMKRLEAPAHPRWTWENWQSWSRAWSVLDAAPMHLHPRILFRR